MHSTSGETTSSRAVCLKTPGQHQPASPAYVDYRYYPAMHGAMPSRVRGRARGRRVAPRDQDGSVYAFADLLTTLPLGLQAFGTLEATPGAYLWQHSLPVVFVFAPEEATDPAYTPQPISWEPWWDETIKPRPSGTVEAVEVD